MTVSRYANNHEKKRSRFIFFFDASRVYGETMLRGTRSHWSRWMCWSTIVKFFMHSCRWRLQFHGRKAEFRWDVRGSDNQRVTWDINTTVRMQVRHRMQGLASCNRSVIDASCNILQLAVAKVPFSSASDSLREHLNTKYARTPVGLYPCINSAVFIGDHLIDVIKLPWSFTVQWQAMLQHAPPFVLTLLEERSLQSFLVFPWVVLDKSLHRVRQAFSSVLAVGDLL